MRTAIDGKTHSHTLLDALSATVAEHIYHEFSRADGLLGKLDRWTRQRIIDENLAKACLVLEAEDPGEACYRDLVREIDCEAETGIYLARKGTKPAHLQDVIDDPGVSGELYWQVEAIAPCVFPDEAARSNDDLDLVWITIEASHDRAHLDATVSEIIMSFLMDDADIVHDMTGVLRSLMYTHHEDAARRQSELPTLLSDAEIHDLEIMVAELTARSGDYDERVDVIRSKVDTLHRPPLS